MSSGFILSIQLAQIDTILSKPGQALAIALAQCLLLVVLTRLALRTVQNRVFASLKANIQRRQFIQSDPQAAEKFFDYCDRVLLIIVWAGVADLCLRFLNLPEKAIALADWMLGTFTAIALSTIVVRTLPSLITTLDTVFLRAATSETRTPLYFYPRFRSLIPLLQQCLRLTVYTETAGLICQHSAPLNWLAPYAHQIVGVTFIYLLAQVGLEATKLGIDEWVNARSGETEAHGSEQQRLQTLAPLCKDCCKYLIYLGAAVCALSLLNIDTAPLLASVGSLGVAFSLGAQNLVQDAIAGLTILFDETYGVGDYIKAGRLEERPIEGTVEAIELRTTQVRHPSGQVQLVRNSAIGSVVNYSKQYAYATVNVSLNPGENLKEVYGLIEEVGRSLQQQYPAEVMEATQVEGLESFSKHRVVIRTSTKVYRGQHQYIQRLLRQRLKERFEQLEQEQQAKTYAAQFAEAGIKSLKTSEMTSKPYLNRRQTGKNRQGRRARGRKGSLKNIDWVESDLPKQGQQQDFRRGSKLRLLFQRARSILSSMRQKTEDRSK